MNTVGKAFALIIAVLLLYIFPISQSFDKQDDISYLIALQSVTGFVDAARDKGYVTPTMYNDLERRLAATGNAFRIEMEHLHKRYYPVYGDPADPRTFEHEFAVDYEGFYTHQIKAILFPDNTLAPDDPARRYLMNAGDFFRVSIVNTNKTNATVMRDFLNNGHTERGTIDIPYGGMVRNEDY
ncbi:hypothetical protein PAE9249_03701 [Paenibacillus sp. CECT 9249]|uniref:hypothetical protein n=1 Tax=Paenibacillus sp. CECT 9249 TaxID=2845385 RepID=UPI001E375A22|nr:hypothetical protein [Paenibacillus sp. CECT 9249]CAH0121175.1 hypothetical protein PAE9249_03701 [Paenibacillus sp. CECT 9249]